MFTYSIFCNIGSPLAGNNIIEDTNPFLYCPGLTVLRVPHLQAQLGCLSRNVTIATCPRCNTCPAILEVCPREAKNPWSSSSRHLVCPTSERTVVKNLGHKGLWRFALLGMQI